MDDDELEWLRNAAPPTSGPDELVRRRARAHVLSAADAPAPVDEASLDVLPIAGAPIDLPPDDAAEASGDSSRRNRVAVVAAATVLLAMVGATVVLGGDNEDPSDDLAETADPMETEVTEERAAPMTTTTRRPSPPAPRTIRPRTRVSAEITPGRTMALDPEPQIADEEVITLVAEGFEASSTVAVSICAGFRAADPRGTECDLDTMRTQNAGASGSIELDYRLHRAITVDDELIDCAAAPCVLSAAAIDRPAIAGGLALTFDPTGEPAPPPQIEVAPTDGLFDGRLLSVTGTGFEPAINVFVFQCVAVGEGQDPTCDGAASGYLATLSDEAGAVTATVRASRYLTTDDGITDCAEAPGRCVVLADGTGLPGELATARTSPTAEVTYDPSLGRPDGDVLVSPSSGLADGDLVTVLGSTDDARGWTADGAALCAGSSATCVDLPFATVELTPRLTAGEISVPRRFAAADGSSVDCIGVECRLRVESDGEEHLISLAFDPDAPLRPEPAASVREPGPYTPGQTITVELPEGLDYWVSQCVADIVDDVCEGYGGYGTGAYFEEAFNGDAAGSPSIDIRVYRRIITQLGPHDCVDDGACELRFFGPFDSLRLDPVQLPFDPAVAALEGPRVTVRPRSGLSDGSTASVRVDGLSERGWYSVAVCPTVQSGPASWCPTVYDGRSDTDGRGATTIRLPRRLTSWDDATLRTVDCALEPCTVRVTEGRLRTDVALGFDPETSLLPDPLVWLAEAGPHDPAGAVEVRGSGFVVSYTESRLRPIWRLCAQEPASWVESNDHCATPREVGSGIDGRGTFVTTIRIGDPTRLRVEGTGERLGCSTCWLMVTAGDSYLQTAGTPIELAAG